MKPTNKKPIERNKLQTPLLLMAAIVVICIALVALAYRFSANQEQALNAQQNALSSARQHFQSAGVEKETITQYLPQYQALIDKGFVGEERRIEWVEELRAQHKNYNLFDVKYNISQQEPYRPSFAANIGGFVLNRSVMKLDLDMLHEGDILQLVESLAKKNTATFVLRDCELTRLNLSTELMSKQLIANLHAQCELDWLTLHEPTAVVQAEVVQ